MILKYNGTPIADAGALSVRVSGAAPGEKATLEIMRDGKPMSVTATIGSASAATVAQNGEGAPESSHLGMTLRPLTKEEREQAGVPGGLVVEDAQGRAAEAGIQQGDVVLSVDGTPVQSVAQLRSLVHDHDKQVALLIQRGDSQNLRPGRIGLTPRPGRPQPEWHRHGRRSHAKSMRPAAFFCGRRMAATRSSSERLNPL